MRNIRVLVMLLAAAVPGAAQEKAAETPKVNSFYERGPGADYALKTIRVEGEVENPGPVELAGLPLRSVAVKEVALADGKPEFRGAYFFTGYSLYDILNAKPVKKVNADFSPETDLYVTVENDKGEKAVFSWGEIYYAKDSFGTLISRSVRSVTAPKRNKDWPLPKGPRLVCRGDLYNTRFIADPSKITVRAVPGIYPGEKHQAVFTPEFSVVIGTRTAVISNPSFAEKRVYLDAAYGHGMGYKEVKQAEGFVLKDVLASAGARAADSGASLVVVSSKDSYRAAFSLAEIINRNDNADFLIVDKGLEETYGRFALFAAPDFFVDRNVRAVDKVEILKI